MDFERTAEIRSSITRELKDHTIRRGGLIGAAGALLLIVAGTFLPLPVLKMWGIPIMVCGLLFITIGLRPYRQLSRLELKPYLLRSDGKEISFSKMGKPILKFDQHAIEAIRWTYQDHLYGVAVKLKRPLNIMLSDPRFDLARLLADSMQRWNECDLFFPYFTETKVKQWALEAGLDQIMHFDNPGESLSLAVENR